MCIYIRIYVCIYGEGGRYGVGAWRLAVVVAGDGRGVMAMAMVVGGDVGEFDKVASFV